mmetsp:Transcript_55008/g.99070  ORF Transcript_55008/g.99070 Transcript_55008/m.99070 type:complete len:83 (-) Transcript_55008:125-373(-)
MPLRKTGVAAGGAKSLTEKEPSSKQLSRPRRDHDEDEDVSVALVFLRFAVAGASVYICAVLLVSFISAIFTSKIVDGGQAAV